MFHGKKALHPDYKGDRTEEDMYNFVQNILDDYGDKVPTRRKDNVNAMASVREHSIEGCNIAGTFKVRRVPGTFTIEANAREHDFDPKSTNTSHVIHHFRFGGPLTNKQQSYIPPRMLHETDPLRNEYVLSLKHFFLLENANTHSQNKHSTSMSSGRRKSFPRRTEFFSARTSTRPTSTLSNLSARTSQSESRRRSSSTE